MTPDQNEHRLKTIFSTILELPIDAVTSELSSEGCEKWDSLNQIHLINGIEEEFSIQIEFEDQMRMMSFAIALEIVTNAQGSS